MGMTEEFFYISVIGDIGLEFYQHADIFKIGKLKKVIEIASDKFIHACLKNLIPN